MHTVSCLTACQGILKWHWALGVSYLISSSLLRFLSDSYGVGYVLWEGRIWGGGEDGERGKYGRKIMSGKVSTRKFAMISSFQSRSHKASSTGTSAVSTF